MPALVSVSKTAGDQLAHDHESGAGLPKDELRSGTQVEMEHTNRVEVAKQIAIDHLKERPDYYTLLRRYVEGSGKESSYKLEGERMFRGLDVAIENKKGSRRYWKDPHGKESGSTLMHADYGYIRRTKGTDGDHVDVYLGPDEDAPSVFIINQMKKPEGSTKGDGSSWKEFDEQKCMLGFSDADAAKALYMKQYDDPRFFGSMDEMPFDEFKAKVLAKKNHGKKIAELLAKEMVMADSTTKVAIGAGFLREKAVAGLAKRGIVLSGKEQAQVARKAIDYARAVDKSDVAKSRNELRGILSEFKKRAPNANKSTVGARSAGPAPRATGPVTEAERENERVYNAYRAAQAKHYGGSSGRRSGGYGGYGGGYSPGVDDSTLLRDTMLGVLGINAGTAIAGLGVDPAKKDYRKATNFVRGVAKGTKDPDSPPTPVSPRARQAALGVAGGSLAGASLGHFIASTFPRLRRGMALGGGLLGAGLGRHAVTNIHHETDKQLAKVDRGLTTDQAKVAALRVKQHAAAGQKAAAATAARAELTRSLSSLVNGPNQQKLLGSSVKFASLEAYGSGLDKGAALVPNAADHQHTDRAEHIADAVDNAGLALLAAPSAAHLASSATGAMAHTKMPGRVGNAVRAAGALAHPVAERAAGFMSRHNTSHGIEVAGLAAVSPFVTKRVGAAVDSALPGQKQALRELPATEIATRVLSGLNKRYAAHGLPQRTGAPVTNLLARQLQKAGPGGMADVVKVHSSAVPAIKRASESADLIKSLVNGSFKAVRRAPSAPQSGSAALSSLTARARAPISFSAVMQDVGARNHRMAVPALDTPIPRTVIPSRGGIRVDPAHMHPQPQAPAGVVPKPQRGYAPPISVGPATQMGSVPGLSNAEASGIRNARQQAAQQAAAAQAAAPRKPLVGAKGLAKAGIIAAGGLGTYAGYRAVDTAANLVDPTHGEQYVPPVYPGGYA